MRHQNGRGISGGRSSDIAQSQTAGGVPGKRSLVEQVYGQGIPGPVQRKSVSGSAERIGHGGAPEERVQGGSGGSPLPAAVQAKMENAFDFSFAHVRVHEDGAAAAVQAQAFAQGNDLHFAPGRYDPHSAGGQELIGHELAHVVQQREGRVGAGTQYKGVAIAGDAGLECEADEWGARAARGESVGRSGGGANGGGGGTIQRRPDGDAAAVAPAVIDTGVADTKFPRVAALTKNGTSSASLRSALSADPSLAQEIPAYLAAGGDSRLNDVMAAAFPATAPPDKQADGDGGSAGMTGTGDARS